MRRIGSCVVAKILVNVVVSLSLNLLEQLLLMSCMSMSALAVLIIWSIIVSLLSAYLVRKSNRSSPRSRIRNRLLRHLNHSHFARVFLHVKASTSMRIRSMNQMSSVLVRQVMIQLMLTLVVELPSIRVVSLRNQMSSPHLRPLSTSNVAVLTHVVYSLSVIRSNTSNLLSRPLRTNNVISCVIITVGILRLVVSAHGFLVDVHLRWNFKLFLILRLF